ncbi:MAG TPA: nuclear transport factor 2 family protein [Chryseolinea sp.]|nr:nuclear transport factor 2 family protein [Chryseolinea sp.]
MKALYPIPAIILIVLWSIPANGQSHDNESTLRQYFSGWENKDWNLVSANLAPGFTFTSPAPDDHISIEKFKEKCWIQTEHIKRFEYIRIMTFRNEALAIMHVITTEGKVIRNTEYFLFDEQGKIKSIEVFFGGTGKGFPTNAQ